MSNPEVMKIELVCMPVQRVSLHLCLKFLIKQSSICQSKSVLQKNKSYEFCTIFEINLKLDRIISTLTFRITWKHLILPCPDLEEVFQPIEEVIYVLNYSRGPKSERVRITDRQLELGCQTVRFLAYSTSKIRIFSAV